MAYQGSAAYNMAQPQRRRTREEATTPSLEVVTGGGLDARARRGVSPQFLARLRAVVTSALVVMSLGLCRVAITSSTAAVLLENSSLQTQISEAQSLGEDLRIERSVLSSNARISRIATQNLGMVFATEALSVTLPTTADEAADAAATATAAADAADADATTATAAADAAAETTDGDAAQAAADDATDQALA